MPFYLGFDHLLLVRIIVDTKIRVGSRRRTFSKAKDYILWMMSLSSGSGLVRAEEVDRSILVEYSEFMVLGKLLPRCPPCPQSIGLA